MNKEDIKNQTKIIIQGDVQTFFTIYHSYYSIAGKVVEGNQIGRTIGFPTANILPKPDSIVPRNGVYAVFVTIGSKIFKGMLNIGNRPTFDFDEITIEVHLLDFSETIYNQHMSIYFVNRIRNEIKFKSKEQLIEQLNSDRKTIRNLLEKSPLPGL